MNNDDASWLEWARGNENVKIVSTLVPRGILPLDVVGRIHDVKVFGKKKQNDDHLYNEYPELRRRVSRGHCLLELEYDDGRRRVICVIRALKKFTSNDERDTCWEEYFTKPIDQTVDIVCTSKTNGEAAHLSPFLIDDQIYLCAGSKNVHMIFKNKEHLDMYGDEPRYRIAMEICRKVLDDFDIGWKRNMYLFMLENRCTAVMELLSVDHQHIVKVEKSALKFIAWTTNDNTFDTNKQEENDPSDDASEKGTDVSDDVKSDDVNNKSLISIRADRGIKMAKKYGFDTIDYKVIKYSQLESHIEKIKQTTNIEGEVMYFVDDQDNTIGLLKKKSVWYVIIRAIREKLRYCIKKELDVEKLSKKFHDKLVDTQTWLKFDAIDEWYVTGSSFFKWIKQQQTERGVDVVEKQFESHFPSLFEEFQKSVQ